MILNYQGLIKQVLEIRSNINTENGDYCLPILQAWYSGYYAPFHRYYIWNGEKQVWTTKKTLRMAKRVCEDWASLLMSEKVDVVVNDKEILHDLLNKLKFWVKMNHSVEVGFALGYSGVAVDLKNVFVNEKGNIEKSDKTQLRLSYFKAGQVVPITFDNGDIIECAFASENKKMLSINAHVLDQDTGEYHIIMYRKDKENGKEYYSDFNTKSLNPLFAIVSPNIENNIDINSDYPLSIFANAIDNLKAIDNKYDTFDNEFVLGKKRLFVSTEMNAMRYSKDKDGNDVAQIENVFDPNDTSIYRIPQSSDGKNMIYSPADPLRVADITAGINAELKILSNKVGLGNDYYNFEKGSVVTATQVISEKSDTFRNLKKHELLLEDALKTIVKAIVYCNNEFTKNPVIGTDDPIIVFDDSIIEDKQSEKTSDRTDLANGIMSKVEYRKKWFGEDEEAARQNIYNINGRDELTNRIAKYQPIYDAGLMTPKMFVNLAYTDDDLKECQITRDELIAYVESQSKSQNITYEDLISGGDYIPPTKEGDSNKNE